MRRFCAGLLAAILCCAAFSFFHGADQVNDTPVNPDGAINIPSDGAQYIPMAGDVIRCNDGTNYPILRMDGYPDSGPLPPNSPEDGLPEGEAIHYRDGSGDYLFIKNLYETRRMLHRQKGEAWDMFKDGVYYKTWCGIWEEADGT